MRLTLHIYTDETLTEVKRVVEAEKLKIPYRVAMYIGQSLDTINIKNNDDIFNFVLNSLDKVDKIIKATFGVTENELDCIDVAELGAVAIDLYKWGIEKVKGINTSSKNAETLAIN